MRLIFCISLFTTLGVGCEVDCNSVEPAYAGDANDEAWRAMLDARPTAPSDSGDASTISVPEPGARFAKNDDPPEFQWASPLQAAALPSSWSAPAARRREHGLFDALSQLVFPQAQAHLPPITGDLHLIEIDVPGRTCPVSGLTTEQSFTFAKDLWQEVTDSPGERTLNLLSAFVSENRVTEGPFLTVVKFSVIE